MEWNTNWNWENLDIFNSKGITSPKKLQSTDWGIEDGEEEDIDGPFNLSDMGNNSSAKSSISESSFKEGMKGSNFSFEGFASFPNAFSKKKEASVSSGEPFIGLKLGKRTYFENSYTKNNTAKTSSFAGVPVSSSVSTGKKVKSSYSSTPIPRCQVEGCNLDLSSAKEYHRKHRVCESHSKYPKVIVAGLERRFCQQCSRFHSMSEFDEEKRSCRRRLSDHNARRRKPHQETIRFNPTIPYSSFYDTTLVETRGAISSCKSKYSVGEVKAEKYGEIDGSSHSIGVQLPHAMHMPTLAFNGLVPSKGARAQNFDQGLKEASSVDLRSALSLLSNNSWDPNLFPLDHPMNSTNHTMPPQLHQGFPLSSPDYWQADTAAKTSNNHFQEFQIFKSFYSTSTPMDDLSNY